MGYTMGAHDEKGKPLGPYITIRSNKGGDAIQFAAFILNFNDEYTTEFQSENILGRMDPIMSYRSTTRKISLEFEVIADSLEVAKANHEKVQNLVKMMYPKYDEHGVLQAAPLLRIHFRNLINSASAEQGKNMGILAAPDGFSYNPDFDSVYGEENQIYPKKTTISLGLTVLHEHGFNFDEKGSPGAANFPYAKFTPGSGGPKVVDASTSTNGTTSASNQSTESKVNNAIEGRVTGSIPA